MDTNSPDTFGAPQRNAGTFTLFDAASAAPEPRPERPAPSAARYLEGDGANLILFTFAPGQRLLEHKAAHPITLQCIEGELLLQCQGEAHLLRPGIVAHLTELLPHAVTCEESSSGAKLLLTMLTGERHQ